MTIKVKVPGAVIDKRFGITSRTRYRWIERGVLPKPQCINGRQYFDVDTKAKFDSVDQNLVNRAFAAYFKTARQEGYSADIPSNRSQVMSHNGKHYVVLANGIWDVLAVYRVRNDHFLKRLRRWPAALGRTQRNGLEQQGRCRDEWRMEKMR